MDAQAASSSRIYGFDLLRGLCALAVAISHVVGSRHAFSFHNLSFYSVYTFFVLSGASLYVAYAHRLDDASDVARYFVNRLLRIVPLYALVSALYLAAAWFQGRLGTEYLVQMFLNVTLLFGLGDAGRQMQVVGGWSLGIEFAFYLMFPVLAALIKTRAAIPVAVIAMVAQRLSIEVLLRQHPLNEVWAEYCQPLSFIGYFAVGCLIGRFAIEIDRRRFPGLVAWTLFTGALLFVVLVQPSTPTESLIRWPAVFLSIACCAAVAAAALLPLERHVKAAAIAGNASYGLYLFHPLIFLWLREWLAPFNDVTAVAIVLALSLPAAVVSNRYFEMPVRRLGRRLKSGSG